MIFYRIHKYIVTTSDEYSNDRLYLYKFVTLGMQNKRKIQLCEIADAKVIF